MNSFFETENAYLEQLYTRYAETRPHRSEPATARDLTAGRENVFRRFFCPVLPSQKDARLLDLGCGYGEFLCFLQSMGYWNTQGIDLDARQVEVGRRLGVQNLRCADGRKFLSAAAATFDFISAIDVLEHIPKHQLIDFLGLVRAALSPQGTFLCQVPNLAAFYTPLFYMDFSHETPFTATSLRQALQLAGFGNARVYGMGPVVHGAKSALRFFLWKGIAAGLRLIQTVEGGPRDRSDSIYTAAIFATAQKC